MTQAPITVWNEVRFTSEGISISLFSESPDSGAILEDEMWYTYDELQEMAPSEPKSLNLSDESKEALSEIRQEAAVGNLTSRESAESGSQQSGQVATLPEVGDVVIDGNPPEWSQDNRLKVVNISDKSADEYVIQEGPFRDHHTVTTANPNADPDEPVVEAEYLSGNSKTYAFPLSRIKDT